MINERVLEAILVIDPELWRGWNFVTFPFFFVCKFSGVSGNYEGG